MLCLSYTLAVISERGLAILAGTSRQYTVLRDRGRSYAVLETSCQRSSEREFCTLISLSSILSTYNRKGSYSPLRYLNIWLSENSGVPSRNSSAITHPKENTSMASVTVPTFVSPLVRNLSGAT